MINLINHKLAACVLSLSLSHYFSVVFRTAASGSGHRGRDHRRGSPPHHHHVVQTVPQEETEATVQGQPGGGGSSEREERPDSMVRPGWNQGPGGDSGTSRSAGKQGMVELQVMVLVCLGLSLPGSLHLYLLLFLCSPNSSPGGGET